MSAVALDPRPAEAKPGTPPAPPAGTAGPSPAAQRPSRLRGRLKYPVIALLAIALGAATAPWLIARWTHVQVSDSRIASTIVTVSAEVAGRVLRAPLTVGDRVADGDLLVQIETDEAELRLEQTASDLARLVAQQSQLRAEQDMVREQVASMERAARAGIAAAEAAHEGSRSDLEMARSDFQRVAALHDQGIVPTQRFEESSGRFQMARQVEHKTAAEVEAARADVALAEADSGRIAVLDRQIEVIEAERRSLLAGERQQRIDLSHRTLLAAGGGVIDQTFVDAGEYVTPGARLLMYHDPDTIWVDANVKETDFRRLAIGATAVVTVDAYPDLEFEGSVARLGNAATSEFALLPSPNPSGNFTKTTQRIPIRIAIAQRDGLLRPGMMVEVTIDADD